MIHESTRLDVSRRSASHSGLVTPSFSIGTLFFTRGPRLEQSALEAA